MKIENRFLKYVSFDTQSDQYSLTSPSTLKQKELGEFLVEEMRILGLQRIEMDDCGVVYGTIPSNNNHQGDIIGLIAHIDTSPDASGHHVKPQIIRNYNGKDIILNQQMTLDTTTFPELLKLVGHDIITTDGTTLLGGDDKAGIAIIMSMAEYLYKHPEFKHNDIRIAFTTDEEIGKGTQYFDLEKFKCDYAYTIDGSDINHLHFETFNAYAVHVKIDGQSVHPGHAKNRMINALEIAMEFHHMLSQHKRPEFTDGYDGFHHLEHIEGKVASAHLDYIVRDHELALLKDQIDEFKRIQIYLNNKYSKEIVHLNINEQYYNMKDIILEKPEIIEQVEIAMKEIGLNPEIVPIRGGSDGAYLSYLGIPCPNLGTGSFYGHGPYEFVSIHMMKKGVELLLRIIKNNVNSQTII